MTAALAEQLTDPQLLASYLRAYCYGQRNATRQRDLAARLGWSVRKLQVVAEALDDQTGRVGTSCGETPGLYWIATEDELEATCANLAARAAAMLTRVTRKRERFAREPQLRLMV